MTHLLDLSQDDVHQPGAMGATKRRKMAEISTKARKALPAGKFALPEQRKYPIHDAAHVRNAAARLEQAKKAGKISSGDYAKAKRAISSAAKRFGIKSEYNAGGAASSGGGLHIRADLAQGGSLHVRHMSDRDVQLDGVAIELADGEAKPIWIQLAKPGTFKGHPAGPFELNERVFDEIVRNFKSTENRAIPIDFEHASEADPTQGSIPVEGAPAQGWIRDLRIQGGALWGLVEWGDRAREYIRSGQYKFFSPAIRFGARDRVTGQQIGARMTSGALTNNPFLDGMVPLAAKDAARVAEVLATMKASLAHSPSEYMPQIKAALSLHPLSSAMECSDHLDKLRDHFERSGGDVGATHEGVQLSQYMHPLRDLVDAAPGTTWDEVFDVVEDLIHAAIEEHVIEDHGGDAEMDDDGDDDVGMSDQKELENMSDQNATAIALSEANTKVAELSLRLKDESARADKAEGELKELRDWKEQRESKDLDDRVELAFSTYKDERKLTDADKEAMLIVLKAKPETFEKQYPKVTPAQQHLLRNLTDKREAPALTVIEGGDSTLANESPQQTTKRLMKEKNLSYIDASNLAAKMRSSR